MKRLIKVFFMNKVRESAQRETDGLCTTKNKRVLLAKNRQNRTEQNRTAGRLILNERTFSLSGDSRSMTTTSDPIVPIDQSRMSGDSIVPKSHGA